MSGQSQSFSLPAVDADLVILDYHDKISDATAPQTIVIRTPGDYNFPDALAEIDVAGLSDSAFVHIEHHYAAPDNFKTVIPHLHISTDRYWIVEGIFPSVFSATATFLYNGSISLSSGYLDNDFITNSEDSLVLLYRASENDDWQIYDHYTLNDWGIKTDKRGAFELDEIHPGEYTLGIYDASIADMPAYTAPSCDFVPVNVMQNSALKIYPDPADKTVTITGIEIGKGTVYFISSSGDTVLVKHFVQLSDLKDVPVKNLPAGTYHIKAESADHQVAATGKLVIIH